MPSSRGIQLRMMLEKYISDYRKVIEIIREKKKKNSCMMVYVNVDVATWLVHPQPSIKPLGSSQHGSLTCPQPSARGTLRPLRS